MTDSQRISLQIAGNYVIEQGDFDDLCGFPQRTGDAHVCLTWGGIAGGMVACDDECRRARQNCATKDLARGILVARPRFTPLVAAEFLPLVESDILAHLIVERERK